MNIRMVEEWTSEWMRNGHQNGRKNGHQNGRETDIRMEDQSFALTRIEWRLESCLAEREKELTLIMQLKHTPLKCMYVCGTDIRMEG